MQGNRDCIEIATNRERDQAMRRSASLLSLGSLVVVLAIFVASWGASTSAPARNLPAAGTPIPFQAHEGILVTNLGEVVFPAETDPDAGTPAAQIPPPPDEETAVAGASPPASPAPGSFDIILRLKRVDMDPGAIPPLGGHVHEDSFVLTVAEGSICYTHKPSVHDSRVTVTMATDALAPEGCATTKTYAECQAGCTLEEGETVYLTAGSTVIQAGTARHWYGNVDPDNPAVVYLAEQQEDDPGAPCAGRCF
jgi:hypothetical protein